MLGFPILYFKGRRLMMFQLSGFYCRAFLGGGASCKSSYTPLRTIIKIICLIFSWALYEQNKNKKNIIPKETIV